MSYGQNYLFGENAISKCEGSLSVLQLLNMDYGVYLGFGGVPYRFEGSLSGFKVQGSLLLCSSTNFVGFSYRDTE